jgi:aspartokinase
MITIAEVVEDIVRHAPLLEEGMKKEIINYSALARQLKPEIEEKVFKPIKTGAIIMALKRFSHKTQKKTRNVRSIFKHSPDMIVRSHLMEYTIVNSPTIIEKHRGFFNKINKNNKYFLIITQGVFETAIIISQELKSLVDENFRDEHVSSKVINLSSITIRLPDANVTTPGLYGYILRSLGWEGINVIEVASTYTEFTIILKESDVDRAFSVLKKTLMP